MTMIDGLKTCAICGSRQERENVLYAVETASGVVVIRGVPAIVCQFCGTQTFERDVALRIEATVDDACRRHAAIEVTPWEAVA